MAIKCLSSRICPTVVITHSLGSESMGTERCNDASRISEQSIAIVSIVKTFIKSWSGRIQHYCLPGADLPKQGGRNLSARHPYGVSHGSHEKPLLPAMRLTAFYTHSYLPARLSPFLNPLFRRWIASIALTRIPLREPERFRAVTRQARQPLP